MAKTALAIIYAANESARSVTNNVTLPTTGANGVSIAWDCSAANVISTTGVVSRSGTDTQVTLTATLTKGSDIATKIFTLTVKGIDAQQVSEASNALIFSKN